MRHLARIVLSLFPLLASFGSSAQLPQVDITLVESAPGELEVRVRPDAAFDELFSALVFTIRWDAASGASLGNESQQPPVNGYMSINKSGGEVDDGGYRYQIFAGFGFSTLAAVGTGWGPGVEYPLMTVPVLSGSSSFQIVNDAWTGANNGNYYVSLNGVDRTGAIYSGSEGILGADGPAVRLEPNPGEGVIWLTLTGADERDVQLEVLDAMGRTVIRKTLRGGGSLREPIDLSRTGAGAYLLKLTAGDATFTRSLIMK